MSEPLAARYAGWLVDHSRAVVLAVLVLTALVAAGAAVGETEDAGIGEFEVDSPETDAAAYVDERYETDDRLLTQVVVRDDGGDVLSRESLLGSLYWQAEATETASIDDTLADGGFQGIENVVATAAAIDDRAADRGDRSSDPPSLDEQIAALESRTDTEVEALVADVLRANGPADSDGAVDGSATEPSTFLPVDHEPGSTDAESRLTFVFQIDDGSDEPEAAYDAQVELEALFEERFDDGFVFGQGITDAASASAVGDSFAIITPVALVLVLAVLALTYRDVVDVLLGLAGIAVVLAWLAGLMGWFEIPMSQLLIAVPFLLIGLSIDYSLHVVMRYREARAGTLDAAESATDVRSGMALGLGGVVLALAAATFSTGVGFLSNVVSPLPAIRDFALLAAGGIFATFVAFAIFVPALKVEVDSLLEGRFDRNRAIRPFGVTPGPANRVLAGGVALARRAPLGVVIVAFLLATAGAYGATTIDTEFNQADFLPEDAPEWAKALPGPLAPDTYTVADDAAYLATTFQDRGEGSQAEILIRGDVTDPALLRSIEDARLAGADWTDERWETIDADADGAIALDGPLALARALAVEDDAVRDALAERDTTDDDVPDEDLAELYDVLYEADPERAATAIERSDDGSYDSVRLTVSVRGDASAQAVRDDVAALAATLDTDADVSTVPTGEPVQTAVIQDALLETLVQAFAVTVVVILAFLTVLYWVRHRALTLGAITLAPVVAALAWLLGTMALLDLPFNSETAVITSLAIGLGVDYSIHVGERFVHERERRASLGEALAATVTGTGGALAGSAATTAAGFGVLALALSPPLQRFGLVTGLAIIFAFLACLTVLPCLLVLRERLIDRLD
ncbi:efflux RND transporter permease subunit [Halovivax gelatinilyticus]|uniref:efflux RND transporter permease subunit n=1 Tax=Halovivax gelatinilyticus TaxID=2961597 RepID=UPI0020CA335B|nr:MMPL family transporter [Halovivax gelatinilyticus]